MNARIWLLLAVAVTFGCGTAAAQDAAERTLSPYFVVEGASEGAEPFSLEATTVSANVSGVIADVVVEQVYRNRGNTPIHARYVFPASTRAAVHAMQFSVGDRRVVARIAERQQATREFEAARRSGRTASLLEQERPNVFRMAVANILPGDRVVVELRYSELLIPTEGVYQFVYPTVVGPRYSREGASGGPEATGGVPQLRPGASADTSFDLRVALSTGVPLADVRSRTHRLNVVRVDRTLARISLASGQGFGGNRDFILDYSLAGEQIESGLLLYEGEHENHFLLMVQPPARVRPEDIPAREYVFVLDVSGSMSGFPLDTAKALITDLIGHLRPTDTFDVLLFSGDARLMAPRSVPATRANVNRAIEMIDDERGGGGTELEAALVEVEAIPRNPNVSRSVVVLTDGYIAEEREAFTRVANGLGATNVFAFGIGSSVNRHLIEGLARAGQGEPFVVTDRRDAAAAASRFRRYIESPVLTQVDVRFEGFDAYDVEPTSQPDLFAQRPIVVFGKWRGERHGNIRVVGRTASRSFDSSVPVANTPSRAENAALPQLWARSRIARLGDFAIGGEDTDTVAQITELGLRYSLLTRYTSFVAVMEQVRNPGGQGANVDQPIPLPEGVSELAVGGEYVSGAEPELSVLVAMLLFGFAVSALRRMRRSSGSAS